MPKFKGDKKISLTRVEKKCGLATKAALVDRVMLAVDNYARVFFFQVENMLAYMLGVIRPLDTLVTIFTF